MQEATDDSLLRRGSSSDLDASFGLSDECCSSFSRRSYSISVALGRCEAHLDVDENEPLHNLLLKVGALAKVPSTSFLLVKADGTELVGEDLPLRNGDRLWVLKQPTQKDSSPALQAAIGSGDVKGAAGALERGVSPHGYVHLRGRFNPPAPLLDAVASGKEEVVRVLLRGGARAGAADTYGNTALHVAAKGASPAIVRVLLSSSPECARVQNCQGDTPLHVAAAHKASGIVALLCEGDGGGAPVVYNATGRLPLHIAAADRTPCKACLAALAAVTPRTLRTRDRMAETPLHLLAGAGCTSSKALGILLNGCRGRVLDAKDARGRTPLVAALAAGNLKFAADVF